MGKRKYDLPKYITYASRYKKPYKYVRYIDSKNGKLFVRMFRTLEECIEFKEIYEKNNGMNLPEKYILNKDIKYETQKAYEFKTKEENWFFYKTNNNDELPKIVQDNLIQIHNHL